MGVGGLQTSFICHLVRVSGSYKERTMRRELHCVAHSSTKVPASTCSPCCCEVGGRRHVYGNKRTIHTVVSLS